MAFADLLNTDHVPVPFSMLPAWASALLLGVASSLLALMVTRRSLRECGEEDRGWSAGAAVSAGFLCGLLTYAILTWKVQETPIVRPSAFWWHWRTGYHCVLVVLMVAATATDLRAYLIPDSITSAGLLIGVSLAFLSGDLQMEHVWVDWNQEVPQFQEAYTPDWIKSHRHWHGLAWSLAGAAAAAGGTWLIRAVSSLLMGQETMGLGDVTLMGMIGSFIGWQPVVFVLVFAPLSALVLGGVSWSVVGLRSMLRGGPTSGAVRPYLPYGPFLCLATYLVLCSWRRLWMWELPLGATAEPFSIRKLFGDWLSLLIVGGGTIGGLVVLLALRRAYQSIPVTRRGRSDGAADGPEL